MLMKRSTSMEDRTFELIEKLYNELTSFREEAREKFNSIDKRLLFIEQDHGNKLQALFDGYKQHSGQLDRIEEKISKHEDIIIRKVK